jgi:hypothetical protein
MTIVVALKSKAGGTICLGIAVHEEDFKALDSEAGGQIDRCSGLANSALLVDKPENLTHGNPD